MEFVSIRHVGGSEGTNANEDLSPEEALSDVVHVPRLALPEKRCKVIDG
jgi:hypothetical protein